MESSNAATRVVVAHRVPLVNEGLAAGLTRCVGVHVLRDSDPSQDATWHAADIVIADQETGLRLLRAWRLRNGGAQAPRPKVLVVAQDDRESSLCAALEAGVDGVTLLDCGLEELYGGLRLLCRGGRYLSPALVSRLADGMMREPLTLREKDVLHHIVLGASNKQIARDLDLALGTVKAHVRTLFAKLGAGTRTQAVGIAQQRGLLEPVPPSTCRDPLSEAADPRRIHAKGMSPMPA